MLADLDADGSPEVILTTGRGKLYAVDARGKLRLEVQVTNYRVSAPAVGDINGDGRPELVFGSEDNEIYALTNTGGLLWSRRIDGTRFGRALPLIADISGDGLPEVLISTPFVGPGPGVYALDGITGAVLWKAPSRQQSYNSTVVADLNGDGRKTILYGDKNTRLYAADASGRALWNTQLDGRGIFFAPAVADLNGDGRATVFQVVRAAGANGKSLYAINGRGEVIDALAIDGGGGSSPMLARFKGEREVKLLVVGGSGKLYCYRLPQRVGAAKVLWQGLRNDFSNTGHLAPAVAAKRVVAPAVKQRLGETHVGARAELLSEVADLIDVWQPDLHLVREQPEALSKIFSKGRYWHYEAPADQRNLDPLGYYRMKPWVAFQMGMTGGGYWVYQSSPYWFFDRTLPTEYGTVHPTDKGPVTTKRWEASRDGAEDFGLLWVVRESARARQDALAAEALKLVDEAVAFVTKGQDHVSDISRQVRPYTPDFDMWMQYRAKLIDVAVRLEKR